MIDKSIRQHYQEGKKVNYIQEGINKFLPQDKTGLDEKQLIKNVAESFLQRKLTTAAASKLAGTGILSSLGPIGMIISMMLANKGIKYAKGKIKPDIKTALQEFQAAMIGSPQEQKELKGLEKRRTNLLQRKEDGKSYSDKNLGMVTRAIAEAKGIDINNPNAMKNIDKDISNLYNKTIYADPSVDSEENQPYNEDIITRPTVEDTANMEDIITRPTVEDTAANENIIIQPIIQSPIYSNPNESAAAERAAVKQAAAVKAETDRQSRNAAAEAAAKERAATAAAIKSVSAYTKQATRPQGNGGGGNGGGGMGKGRDPGGGAAGSPFAKGGRVDKPFPGRSRDI